MATESKAQHTPGPWEVLGYTMVVTPVKSGVMPIDATQSAPLLSESRANARLIAAAPELLEALEGLLVTVDRTHFPLPYDAAQAAIRKAKGVQDV